MFSNNLASTAFWVFLASTFQASSAFLLYYTFFNLASEAFFNSFLVNDLCDLKKVSSTLALTPSSETLVDVAIV
jgi:hypothetical protein